MIDWKKDEYNAAARRLLWKFQQIAKALGKDHPITKMMGSRAWGRHNYEQGPEGNLRTAIREYASLLGAFDVMNKWVHDNDYDAQKIMRKIWDEP